MVDLEKFGMYEYQGVLIQPFENGKAMQVRMETDKVGVRTRQVSEGLANDTKSDDPAWLTAYDYVLAEWIGLNSPVWQWLKEKGINEVEVHKRLLKLK